jgi:hypothetical protein
MMKEFKEMGNDNKIQGEHTYKSNCNSDSKRDRERAIDMLTLAVTKGTWSKMERQWACHIQSRLVAKT